MPLFQTKSYCENQWMMEMGEEEKHFKINVTCMHIFGQFHLGFNSIGVYGGR